MFLELKSLLTEEGVAEVRRHLRDAPFHDGKSTAQGAARDAKHNLQLDPTDAASRTAAGLVLAELSKSETFRSAVLPRTILPLRFCKYSEGMEYGEHLDLPVMATASGPLRTDLSITIWLSEPDDYEGGELVLMGTEGERTLKGQAGDAVVYASTLLHRVNRVLAGERLVAISWIQSLVRDGEPRALLLDLLGTASDVAGLEGGGEHATALRRVHYRLLRRWADC